jgi:raffinose/stachyose/melibiose transport system substrate-binding protein
MKTKRNVSGLIVVLLVVSMLFTACGGSSDNGEISNEEDNASSNTSVQTDSNATDDSEENTETASADKIVVFQSKVEIIDQLEALAIDYEEETGVEVEVWGTTGDDYLQQLRIRLSNNQGPTVFSLAPGSESSELAPYLADLSDISFADDIADGMADVMDGKLVGVPYTVEGFGVVYNKSMIDPTVVADVDTFETMLKEKQAEGINGFSLSQESYFMIGHILNTPFALVDDPKTFTEDLIAGEVTMNDSEEFVEFAELMVDVRENSVSPLDVNYDIQTGDFATGKTASIHQGNWVYGMFADYDMDFEMGMMPLPIAGNDSIAVSVPSSWYVNSQASAEEIQAGQDFLEWLYTSENGQRYLSEEFGFIPILKSVDSTNLDPLSAEVARYTAEGKTIAWPMSTYWPAGIVDVYLVPVAEEFFTTDMGADELLTKLSEAFVEAGK